MANAERAQAERAQAPRAFEEYVNIALHAREGRDNAQWVLGDVANEVKVFYGEDSIGRLATEIGMKKSTLLTYRTVCRVFPPAKRLEGLSFTHHQLCAPKLNAEEWLAKANDGGWSCDKLTYELDQAKEENPEKLAKQEEKIKVAAKWLKGQFEACAEAGGMTSQQATNIVKRVMEIVKRGNTDG